MATPEADDRPFRPNERVVAAEDLPGVPAGTPGTVLMVGGLTWTRYRVRFANGIELGLLDGRRLRRASETPEA